MKYVGIYDVTDTGSELRGIIVLTDGNEIKFLNLSEAFVEDAVQYGIVGKLGKRYFPKDGLAFLENLKYEYHGSRMYASDVKESKWKK